MLQPFCMNLKKEKQPLNVFIEYHGIAMGLFFPYIPKSIKIPRMTSKWRHNVWPSPKFYKFWKYRWKQWKSILSPQKFQISEFHWVCGLRKWCFWHILTDLRIYLHAICQNFYFNIDGLHQPSPYLKLWQLTLPAGKVIPPTSFLVKMSSRSPFFAF